MRASDRSTDEGSHFSKTFCRLVRCRTQYLLEALRREAQLAEHQQEGEPAQQRFVVYNDRKVWRYAMFEGWRGGGAKKITSSV